MIKTAGASTLVANPIEFRSEAVRWTLTAFIAATELVFIFFTAAAGIEFVLSSLIVTAAILIQLWFGIKPESRVPADVVAFIFNWLFLDLAPKIQLVSMTRSLVNTSGVTPDRLVLTNFLCALFIITFTIAYSSLGGQAPKVRVFAKKSSSAGPPERNLAMSNRFSGMGIFIALFACFAVVAGLGSTPYGTDPSVTMAPTAMVIKKFLLFVPSATLLIFLHEAVTTGRRWNFSWACALLALVLLVAITENPLTEKRNALGPVYLGMLFIVFQSTFGTMNRKMLLLVVSMVLIFPTITVLTHSHRQFLSGIALGSIVEALKDHYFSVNYDAWANIYTITEMVSRAGIEWGRQLLGDFLFFVPSNIWHHKPIATGIAIGNFLILNHSGWFTNLSAPLIGEAYFDFGVPGVIIYAAALASLIEWLNKLARDGKNWLALPFALYMSLFLMFVLRGSLMIAFAYGTGAILAFLMAYGLLSSGSRRIGQRYHIAERAQFDLRQQQSLGVGVPPVSLGNGG